MKYKQTERGQALILIAIGMVGLIGVTALALDAGNVFADRRAAQNAADTSAMAAALSKVSGQDWYGAGYSRAETNGFHNDGISNTVDIYSPPIEGLYAGDEDYLQVIIVSNVQTWFAPVIGIEEVSNRVTAVAKAQMGGIGPMFSGHAIVALSPNGCHNVRGDNGYGGVWLHGNSVIDVQGSGIFSNSIDANCSLSLDGNTSAYAPYINLIGGADLPKNCDPIHGYPCTNGTPPITTADQISYPPQGMIFPEFACEGAPEANINNGNTLTTDGEEIVQVNEDFPPNGITAIEPGIYCVMPGNQVRNNGSDDLIGTGVTIVVLGGDITLTGGGLISITAPESGDSAGLAIYVPPGYSSTININGTSDSSITGTILAPESSCNLSGNEAGGYQSQVICWDVSLGGDGNTTIIYEDGQNYDAVTPPVIELVQ